MKNVVNTIGCIALTIIIMIIPMLVTLSIVLNWHHLLIFLFVLLTIIDFFSIYTMISSGVEDE